MQMWSVLSLDRPLHICSFTMSEHTNAGHLGYITTALRCMLFVESSVASVVAVASVGMVGASVDADVVETVVTDAAVVYATGPVLSMLASSWKPPSPLETVTASEPPSPPLDRPPSPPVDTELKVGVGVVIKSPGSGAAINLGSYGG